MTRLAGAEALGHDTRERILGHGAAVLDAAKARFEQLATLAHPGVLVPLEVYRRQDDAVVAVMPGLDGDDLATLLAARGPLRVGECVTLGMAVAGALAAMHRAGIAHGDISPANIMIDARHVTLVDTMAGANAAELGTPGFAAPERPAGASAPSDVYALGHVLLAAVRDADAERMAAWAGPMIVAESAARPTAAMVQRALASCADPEPIAQPMLGVAASMRARAEASNVRTTRRDDARWWRVRRLVIRWARWGAVALVLALFVAFGPRVWDAAHPPAQPNFAPTMPVPASAAIAPAEAAQAVILARFEALAAGDAQALLETTVAGSEARLEVEPVAAALAGGELSVEGLAASIVEVHVESASGRRATAVVTYAVSDYTMWDASGQHANGAVTQTVEIDLVWSEAGWQAQRVRASEP